MTVFVSKKVTHPGLLDLIEKRNVKLIDTSMISFEEAEFDCPKNSEYDIVFFSSPRSVDYFLEKCELTSDTFIACIGKTTKKALLDNHIQVDFAGDRSGQPDDIARSFKQFVDSKKVLFPQSDRSNKSMQQQLPEEQILNLVVYITLLTPVKLQEKADILIFTSPSNVAAYIERNEVHPDQKVIAWGTTTEKFLKANGFNPDHVLERSSFDELTGYLETIL